MRIDEIIRSLLEQAQDRESSIDEDDPDCIFRRDAAALREAAHILQRSRDRGHKMVLYDNDAYRDEFMESVYGILNHDSTWDRANQIIDLFDAAPVIEPLPNTPLTLDELREMDGEPVWITKTDGDFGVWMLVDKEYELCREAHGDMAVFENYEKTWMAYRRRPEEALESGEGLQSDA